MNYRIWITAFVLSAFPVLSSAGYYKYVDENGVVHFTDNPHPANQPSEIKKYSEPDDLLSPLPDDPLSITRRIIYSSIATYKVKIKMLKSQIESNDFSYKMEVRQITEKYSDLKK